MLSHYFRPIHLHFLIIYWPEQKLLRYTEQVKHVASCFCSNFLAKFDPDLNDPWLYISTSFSPIEKPGDCRINFTPSQLHSNAIITLQMDFHLFSFPFLQGIGSIVSFDHSRSQIVRLLPLALATCQRLPPTPPSPPFPNRMSNTLTRLRGWAWAKQANVVRWSNFSNIHSDKEFVKCLRPVRDSRNFQFYLKKKRVKGNIFDKQLKM